MLHEVLGDASAVAARDPVRSPRQRLGIDSFSPERGAELPHRNLSPAEYQERMAALDQFAETMDASFRIPGTQIRFGPDNLVGLVPGIGDAVTLISHGYVFYQAYKLGARKRVHARMLVNALIDTVGGTVPLVGDVFDVYWKSHRRNVRLLKRELERHPMHSHPVVEGKVVAPTAPWSRQARA